MSDEVIISVVEEGVKDIEVSDGSRWGSIGGDIDDQSDLKSLLNTKVEVEDLGEMAFSDDAPSDDNEYVRKNGGWRISSGSGSLEWGDITGTLSNQLDLKSALDAKQNALTFDNIPTANSNNPVKSGGIKTALDEKANTADLGSMAAEDDAPSNDKQYARKNGDWSEVENSGGTWGSITGTLSNQTDLQSALNNKQNTLIFDDNPTAGSNNPVKSDGIKLALDDKANTADLGSMAEEDDAASNNKAYGRKDGAWYDLDGRYYTESEMDTKLGEKEDKTNLKALAYKDDSGSDNKSYARKNNGWQDITSILAAVTYIVEGGAGSRNSFYRNVSLGNSCTTAQKNQISAGTFTDLYLGGYWNDTAQNLLWRIWGFDYLYNRGDTVTSAHHLAIMPDQNLLAADGSTTHYMNDTDTTTGGYKGTKLRSTYLSQCITKFTNFFGKAPLSHRELISNAVSDGKASGWEWVSTQCEVPSEVMMYGSIIWGQSTISNGSGYNIGISYPILPLAQVAPWHVRNGANYWLRDVVSASSFALVVSNGYASTDRASNPWVGVRPLFLLS